MEAVQAVQIVPEANSSYLAPFNFQTFQTKEAVWSLDKHEMIKMFRVTTKGVGDFLGSTHRRPEKAIDKIIERNPHIKKLAVAVTVTITGDYKWGHSAVTVTAECPTRTRQIVVNTFDIWGVYQIAVVSKFPRAKIFLQEFPKFLQAFQNYTIKPPPIGDIKPEVLGFFGVKYKERVKYAQAACAQYGWGIGKFYKQCKIAIKTLGVLPQFTRKPRKDKGSCANHQAFQQVNAYSLLHPDARGREIKKVLDMPVSEHTINRWIRAHKINLN